MRHLVGQAWTHVRVLLREPRSYLRTHVVYRLLTAVAFAVLAGLACVERPRSAWRRWSRRRPRLIWGPSAILNIKYYSAAMRHAGYESATYVDLLPTTANSDDFDLVQDEFFRHLPKQLRPYAMFARALRHGDLFIRFFDMGFLRTTPLQWLEYPLTRLAGKKIVVTSYGGDVAVAGYLGDYETILLADYPDLPKYADLLKRRVDHTARWAEVNVRTTQLGYQPGYNAIVLHMDGIDTDLWHPNHAAQDSIADEKEVVVVHAPNHRTIKGTDQLEAAVDELRRDGLPVELKVLEGRTNEEVRETVITGDIVADQFYGGYGLFALEGMAAGKPVLSNLDMWWLPEDVQRAKRADGCPIVDTDLDNLREDLRRLIEDPGLRREIGQASRDFVMRYHTYEAASRVWETLIQFAWNGTPLPEEMTPSSAQGPPPR
jgi:glycosyltransferase involved in cell wall biosynthesis